MYHANFLDAPAASIFRVEERFFTEDEYKRFL
jgi:hypothetical protein